MFKASLRTMCLRRDELRTRAAELDTETEVHLKPGARKQFDMGRAERWYGGQVE